MCILFILVDPHFEERDSGERVSRAVAGGARDSGRQVRDDRSGAACVPRVGRAAAVAPARRSRSPSLVHLRLLGRRLC